MVEKQYGCPVEVTLDVIGGKWKCVILWWLRRGARRFGELMQLMPGISQKVLTTQLRQLEADRLVSRQVFQVSPRRVEYSLTAYGETLRPITDLMCEWGKAHAPGFQFGLKHVQGLRILVVANDIVSQRLEAELGELRRADVNATSLVMALENLNQLQPDIVLIDFSLDDDFNSLKQRLEASAEDPQKTIPAIALIANNQERDRALSQGFRIYLMEPVEISELIAEIANLTGRLE
ncbi:MAG: winged helix-turn-helix transcriptional regulator [Leptolyngbyaceae cyanobacterium MO_188.B28]|nr:winged helix-turn-helix transcriptional regulator [Leptolyngbyaceae cyanobacterium MO_188.B28]